MGAKKQGFFAGLLVMGLLWVLPALAQAKAMPAVSYTANPYSQAPSAIYAQDVKGTFYLFLPSSANLSSLRLDFEPLTDAGATIAASAAPGETLPLLPDQPFDLLALFPNGPVADGYPVTFSGVSGGAEGTVSLTLMRSANLGSLYITSDDPASHGREWLDQVDGHAEGTTAQMTLLRTDGTMIYDGALAEIRGRGNTTWFWSVKRPYQIKLEQSTNLLDDGNAANRNKVWVLLAEAFDATLLHNTLTLSLGRETGLFGTPDLRPVDLYYDGEYRGYYLVCEKVQVDPGRLDILDYGKYIQRLYGKKLGVLDTFPLAQGADPYGNEYQYVDGVQAQLREKGAYLIELDMYNYKKEKSWFFNEKRPYEIHSPAHASQADVEYLSCLMQEMTDTIKNHGIHPTNGKTITDYLDLPSMVRFFLINEFAKTCDLWYTSTYFHIPEGANKLYAGPLWDFDIAYAIRDTRLHEGGVDGYVPEKGWMRELMTLPIFQEAVKEYYTSEFEPMLRNVLLGDASAQGKALLSLEGYLAKIESSRKMNFTLWEPGGGYNNINQKTLYPTYEENLDYFRAYLAERTEWLSKDIAEWSGAEIENVNLTISYTNANILEHALVQVNNLYANCTMESLAWSTETDQAEPYHTFYTATIALTANEGSAFAALPTVHVNGYPVELLSHDEERVTFAYRFAGPTYAPAVYDDVDYSLIYNYDYFLEQNPEVLEECGDDPEDVLDYFVSYGIGEGLRAIETFDAEVFIANYEKVMDAYYMCDTEMSTLHYLEHCYDENLLGLEEPVVPAPAE